MLSFDAAKRTHRVRYEPDAVKKEGLESEERLMAGKSPWRAVAASVAGGGAAAGGAADDDAQMPDADADADADGASGGVLVDAAAEGGAGRALRLPVLTMGVALEECEKARHPCLPLPLTLPLPPTPTPTPTLNPNPDPDPNPHFNPNPNP